MANGHPFFFGRNVSEFLLKSRKQKRNVELNCYL